MEIFHLCLTLLELAETQGYSTHATREFLNLLESPLRTMPFVIFSDHDTRGAQILANLKYGSILSSYGTDIQLGLADASAAT